ncbi:FtsX-like permease family protein (plasmid) [Roseomonas sp. OT10]|uniref:FtsX-like permease family protein n=1 Tax=Roseomonas cutis TaxID=2897332 RepID=UPI001E3D4961|nr:FtsX-like permease family protein [Roseomonas sp. OT10]UFN51644.1 FtsX-like permease family protein [Roseomonas sp. OT10]
MMNPWPVARAALRRRPWTAAALSLLVALAVALGVAVGAVERGAQAGSVRAVAGFDLIVGAPGSPTQLVLASVFLRPDAVPLMSGAVLGRLQQEQGIAWFSPIGFGDNWRGNPIVGVTEPFVTRGGRRALAEGRLFAGHEEAVVGAAVPLRPGESLTPGHGRHADPDEGEGHGHEHSHYTVVGRLPPQGNAWDHAILVPIESVWELHGLGDGHGADAGQEAGIGAPWTDPPGVPAVVVAPVAVADAYRLRNAYRGPESTAVFTAEVLVPLLRVLGDVRDLMVGIAGVTTALVLLAVFLSLTALLATRRRELAMLRAIGAPRAYVLAAAWTEMGVILGAGAVAGLALGLGLAHALAALAKPDLAFDLPVRPAWTDLAVPLLACAVGLLAALLPAFASSRRPVEADLRQ